MRISIAAAFLAIAASASAAPAAAQQAQPPAPTDDESVQNAASHGSVSIVYYDTFVNGFWLTSNRKAPIGGTHSRALGIEGSLSLGTNWSVYAAIDYVDKSYGGSTPDCASTAPPQCVHRPPLTPQHPEAPFVDDGKYHGTWQDITVGAARRIDIGGYTVTPSVTALIPSHDYPIYGFSAPGQRLHQLLLDVSLSHQFDFTNFYYKLGYGYAFSQHVRGVDTGYQRFDAELGWFVNEKFSVRGFLAGRMGNGLRFFDTPPPGWQKYYKNQTFQHDSRAFGFGFDYDFGNRYLASASVQRLFWGDTTDDLKYAFEARLTRQF